MGLFSTLFGGGVASDPTINWPAADGLETPGVDLGSRRIGPLKFGDPLHAARNLGRPERSRFIRENYLELTYARAGFQLDFEDDKLAYGAFFVGPDTFLPDINGLRPCEPSEQTGHRFSARTTESDLLGIYGRPREVDRDEGETIVTFVVNELQLEFELNSAGKLKRWNLYPVEKPSR